jgi:hypothetical protein
MTARCVVWFETVDAEKKKEAHSNGVFHKLAQFFGCHMFHRFFQCFQLLSTNNKKQHKTATKTYKIP